MLLKICLSFGITAALIAQGMPVIAQNKAQGNFPLQEVKLLESPFLENGCYYRLLELKTL